MKTCPHCDSPIPELENRCPACGIDYWDPDMADGQSGIPAPPIGKKGCLSFLLIPILTAVVTVVFLIFAGFILNMLFHFESNQIKIIWTAGSFFLGFILYKVINHYKANRENGGK